MPVPPRHLKELYDLFSSIETPQEARMLMEDILTPGEIASIAQRWQEIRMLARGVTQREISKRLNVSISKVTRGSRMLQQGSGGFRHFLKKLGKE